MVNATTDEKRGFACAICWMAVIVLVLIAATIAVVVAVRFLTDRAIAYSDPEEHFRYGSTGGEREMGFPYWIFKALPGTCPDLLPGDGFESLGMISEPGRRLPVGMSERRHLGLDRVFINCAVCHSSTVRTAPDAAPVVVSGMPANRFDIMGFQTFFFECGVSARFTPKIILAQAQAAGAKLGFVDRQLIYPLAVYIMRERLLSLRERFEFVRHAPAWGPGRVDTWNSAKAGLNFPYAGLAPAERVGMTDFPSIWNQRQRRGMRLHWTGNNTRVEERNRSAALGTGATPPTLDRDSIKRMEDWLLDAKPPPFDEFFAVDGALAARGWPIYRDHCADCHGQNGDDFTGERVGTVIPIEEIGTDRRHLDSYTHVLAVNQNTFYAGYGDERFSHFRKTFGYASMPLDGIWLRAPYLHNGSVPSLRALLEPASRRPAVFYRGNDLYDPASVGFVSDVAAEGERRYFRFETSREGNSNKGHEGPAYGTQLPDEDKRALLEYLKTF
jgi:mono/diheme cytochrome c family protein